VDELLALKARYQEMAGLPWSPAPASKLTRAYVTSLS
jgi:hypothetical protein